MIVKLLFSSKTSSKTPRKERPEPTKNCNESFRFGFSIQLTATVKNGATLTKTPKLETVVYLSATFSIQKYRKVPGKPASANNH